MNGNPSRPNDTSFTSVAPPGGEPEPTTSAQTAPDGLVPRQAGGGATPDDAGLPAAGSDDGSPGLGMTPDRRPRMLRPDVLRAYWLSPAGLVILAATGLALALRLFLLSRPLFLTGVTEYDDGVYLGGAIRLISGDVPYHGFAFVQPPGILLLMAPVAVIAKVSTATHAMAAARLLTVLASALCVPLVGHLVRYRGVFVTVVSCGILAVYPDDITTAHTLILEPWMNLLLLIGVCAAFRRGRLTTPRRLFWAGVAIGFAGAVKYWAVLPGLALLVVCLVTPAVTGAVRRRRTCGYALGVVAGFAVPVLPFAAAGPGLYLRSTLLDQASRAGSAVPASLRLAHITGLIDILNGKGQITLHAGTHSLFASGGVASHGDRQRRLGAVHRRRAGGRRARARLPVAARPVVPARVVRPRQLPRRGGGGARVLGVLLSLRGLRGALAGVVARLRRRDALPRVLRPARGAALADRGGGGAGARPGRVPDARAVGAAHDEHLPGQGGHPGRLLRGDRRGLADAGGQPVLDPAGCPDVLDSLATTLVEDDGVSVQGGAKTSARTVAAWTWIFGHARYVWLSPDSDRRIPWTHGLEQWFGRHFKRVPVHRGLGRVYQRRS